MAFVFRPTVKKYPRKILKAKEKITYERMRDFLQKEEPQLVKMLEIFWARQSNQLTYQEIQQAYLQGDFTGEQWLLWQEAYSRLILEQMLPIWENAVAAAVVNIATDFSIPFLTPSDFSGDYYRNYGANLVTNLVGGQRQALQSMLWELFQNQHMTATESSYFLRPLIGLTSPQMAANQRYYSNILQGLREEFPDLSPFQAQEQARLLAEKYAARQHRYRAQMIARTELATFFNAGHDLAIHEAMAQGLLPAMDSIWSATEAESTCDLCRRMDGERVPTGTSFSNGSKYPPIHPHCMCDVIYEPREGLTGNPILTDSENVGIMSIGDKDMDNITGQGSKFTPLKYTSFQTEKKLNKHLADHLSEYDGFTPEMYVERATELLNAQVGNSAIEGFTGKEGFVFRYDPKTNDLALGHFGGSISTLYKPVDGYQHWLELKQKHEPKEE